MKINWNAGKFYIVLLLLLCFFFTYKLCRGEICLPNDVALPFLSNLPSIKQSDLIYQGSFRVPRSGVDLSYSSGPIAYYAGRHSLIIMTRSKQTVELSIPPLNSTFISISTLPTATIIQNPSDLSSGTYNYIELNGTAPSTGTSAGGLLVYNDKLVGSLYSYYDASNSAYYTHYTANLNWNISKGFSGLVKVGLPKKAGYIAGYLADIPLLWQGIFGGTHLTGLGGVPIISRTNLGPGVSVFNVSDLSVITPALANTLIEYPTSHPTLGIYTTTEPNLYFNRTSTITGVIFPENSKSMIFFGSHGLGVTGLGDSCYGLPTNDITLHNTKPLGSPDTLCYDLTNGDKGPHAYPYTKYAWVYDAVDLIPVKQGIKNPWEVIPYELWRFNFPTGNPAKGDMGPTAFDASTSTIYMVQSGVDKPGVNISPTPLIHVYRIQR